MSIYAMVTTENSKVYTEEALKSFFINTKLSADDLFFLIDNDSSYELPQTCKDFPISIIKNQKPQSFAANANHSIDLALENNTDLFFLNNDVIFSKNWNEVFLVNNDSVLVPVSNNEVQYTIQVSEETSYSIPMKTELENYLVNPKYFEQIVVAHKERNKDLQNYIKLLVVPFFVVKIPNIILKTVGKFDLDYGIGGGEDFDYCIRTHIAGFSVLATQKEYLLHFGGRSINSSTEQKNSYISVFRKKWGSNLAQLIFGDTKKIIENAKFEKYDFQKEGFQDFIKSLL
jgi:GT2 family glycosyltransferase